MPKEVIFQDPITGTIVEIEPIPPDVDPREFMRQRMQDCPECQAALARGEQPTFGDHHDLEQLVERRRAGHDVLGKKRRWRDLKRRR